MGNRGLLRRRHPMRSPAGSLYVPKKLGEVLGFGRDELFTAGLPKLPIENK